MVALAASLWGTDGLLRKPLADELPAATIVFFEHAIVVLILLPWLPAAVRALRTCTAREKWAMFGIGAGASATATVLFTRAFAEGDPVTPLVMQKLQPIFAIVAAHFLLGEQLRRRFALFVIPALAGAWLLAFPDPFDVQVAHAKAALLSVSAAALWAGGTVLGRMVSERLAPRTVTQLRFAIGLPASLFLALLLGAPLTVSGDHVAPLVALALIPGLLALMLYYRGLRRTPAARATLAELAFPVTAALVGTTLLDVHLTSSQWLGGAIIVVAVTTLGWHERVSSTTSVAAPVPAAVGTG
jgi:drug/metabolite transporter, DME family